VVELLLADELLLSCVQFGGRFGGAFGGLAGFMGGMNEDGRFGARPEHYDEFFKAYSMAMLPGKERAQVSYGGKSKLQGLHDERL
jgi:hypothetical protein